MERIKLPMEKCRDNAVAPTYANDGDAGMDLYSCEDILVKPGCSVLVPTGLKMAIPYGYEVQIRPRSGISLKESPIPPIISAGYIFLKRMMPFPLEQPFFTVSR